MIRQFVTETTLLPNNIVIVYGNIVAKYHRPYVIRRLAVPVASMNLIYFELFLKIMATNI